MQLIVLHMFLSFKSGRCLKLNPFNDFPLLASYHVQGGGKETNTLKIYYSYMNMYEYVAKTNLEKNKQEYHYTCSIMYPLFHRAHISFVVEFFPDFFFFFLHMAFLD